MCTHRLSAHDDGRGFHCAEPGSKCNRFEFQVVHPVSVTLAYHKASYAALLTQTLRTHPQVQEGFEAHKCRCKHAPKDHAPTYPWACRKAGCNCNGFNSPWRCNWCPPFASLNSCVCHPTPARSRASKLEWMLQCSHRV